MKLSKPFRTQFSSCKEINYKIVASASKTIVKHSVNFKKLNAVLTPNASREPFEVTQGPFFAFIATRVKRKMISIKKLSLEKNILHKGEEGREDKNSI